MNEHDRNRACQECDGFMILMLVMLVSLMSEEHDMSQITLPLFPALHVQLFL